MTHRTRIRTLGTTLAAGALLSIPAASNALDADSTALVSLPSGAVTAPSDGINTSGIGSPRAASSDGRYVVFTSASDDLLGGAARDAQVHCFIRDTSTGVTTLLDTYPGGPPGEAECGEATISGDGTVVAFTTASALVPNDGNNREDVYMKNVAGGFPVLMSVAPDGGQLAEGGSSASIAAFGAPGTAVRRIHVAFVTLADMDALDSAGTPDVYVRRTATLFFPATTLLASRHTGPVGSSLGDVTSVPSISEDGDRVTFTTPTSLDAGDTNPSIDVYIRSTYSATTQLASRADGLAGAVQNGFVGGAVISRDGSTVAFSSTATNLGGGPGGVYTRTLASGVTRVASAGDAGPADRSASLEGISDDGGAVAFGSDATNLGAGDTGRHAYVRRLTAPATTTLVSRVDGAGGAPAVLADRATVSGDGAAAVFTAAGAELAPGARSNLPQVFLRTIGAQRTRLVSRPGADTAPLVQETDDARLTANTGGRSASRGGRYVVFTSESPSLPGGAPGRQQVYRRDMTTGETRLISRTADGTAGNGPSADAVVSGDGAVVAFTTEAPNLGGVRFKPQIAVWRAATDRLTVASVAPDGTPGDGFADVPALDADGTTLAFQSNAGNLGVPNPGNTAHIWVRDLGIGTTILASRADGPAGAPLNAGGRYPSLSADGTRVSFGTNSTNAGNGDTGSQEDVHVRDLVAGRTIWASRADGPDGAGNADSTYSSLNADGTIVAFDAEGSLSPEDAGVPGDDVFTRNLVTNRTVLQSRADGAAGARGDGDSRQPVISDDGNRVAFVSSAPNLAPDDINNVSDAFVRIAGTGTTLGISRLAGVNGTLLGGRPGGSPDLTCIPFISDRPALVPGGYRSPDFTQVYLRSVGAPCAAVASPGPAGPGGPAATTTPPVLSRAGLRPARFRAGTARGRGSTLRFTLSRAATVTAIVQRPRPGRIIAGTCRIRQRTGRRCTVWTRTARFTMRARAGATTRRFTAVFARRALPAGRYRLRLTPTGGTTRTITFRVTGR